MAKEIKLVQGATGVELVHPENNWVLTHEDGFSPVETLGAAIGCCSVYVYQKILENSHIPFTFVGAEVTYERDEAKPANPISHVKVTIQVDIEAELQGKAERAVHLIERNCPVIQSLDKEIVVEEIVEFVKA